MKKTNALHLRQNLGSILKLVEKPGNSVLIERNRQPAAVIINIEDYKLRFVDQVADQRRKDLVESILKSKYKPLKTKSSLDLIREGRE